MIKRKMIFLLLPVVVLLILSACQENSEFAKEDKLLNEFIGKFYKIDDKEISCMDYIDEFAGLVEYKYKDYMIDSEFERLVKNRAFYNNQVNL